MRKLKLAHVATVDFRMNEATNIIEQIKQERLNLKPSECAMLWSVKGDQVIFVKCPTTVELLPGRPRGLFMSARFRLDGGSWYQNLPAFFAACEDFGMDVVLLRGKVYDYLESIGKPVHRGELKAVG